MKVRVNNEFCSYHIFLYFRRKDTQFEAYLIKIVSNKTLKPNHSIFYKQIDII